MKMRCVIFLMQQRVIKTKRKGRKMMKAKFLTSVCVILAGLYGTAYGAASLRAGAIASNTGASGTTARAGTLRTKSIMPSAGKASVSTSGATSSSDSARLSSLPGIGANKLSISPKLPSVGYSVAPTAEIEDLRKELAGVRTEIDTSLNEVMSSIDTVERVASVAAEKAETAHAKAESAETVATTAQTAAETAQSAAVNAQTTAETASVAATTASATAQTASGTAAEAKTTAESALSAANIDLGLRISGDRVEYTTKASAETPTWKEAAKKSIFEGVDGKTPVIGVDTEKIFYTYEGEDATEANKKPIVTLDAIKGAPGATPILANDKENKRLTIKYAADETPVQLVSYSDIGSAVKIVPATETTPAKVCDSDKEEADCIDVLSSAYVNSTYLKSTDAANTYLKSTDAESTYAAKDILSKVSFTTNDTDVLYSVERDENNEPINYQKFASKSAFSGTVGAAGQTPAIRRNDTDKTIDWAYKEIDKDESLWDWKPLVALSAITGASGADACTAVTTSYTGPDETTAATVNGTRYYTKLGYTTVETTNRCDSTQNTSYTQDDVCDVSDVDRANNADFFVCKKQDGSGTYNFVKTDSAGLHSIFGSLVSEKKQEYVAPTGCDSTNTCTTIGYMKIYDMNTKGVVKDAKNRDIVSRVDDTCVEDEYTDNNIKMYRRQCTKQEVASGGTSTYYMASELNIIPTTDQNYTEPQLCEGSSCSDCTGAEATCSKAGFYKVCSTVKATKKAAASSSCSNVEDQCIEVEDLNASSDGVKAYRRQCTRQGNGKTVYYLDSDLNKIPTTDQNYTEPQLCEGSSCSDCTGVGATCSKAGFYKVCSTVKATKKAAASSNCSNVEDQCTEEEDPNASSDGVKAYRRQCTRQGNGKTMYYLDSDLNKIPTSDQNYVEPDNYDGETKLYGTLGYMNVCTNAAVAAQVEQPQTMMRGGAKAASTNNKCSKVYDSCEEVTNTTTGVIKTYKRQCTRQGGENKGTTYDMASDLNNIPTSDHNYVAPVCDGDLCTELGYYNICTGTASELVAIKSRGGVKGASNAQCSKAYDTCVEEAVAEVQGKGTSYRRECTRQDNQATYYMASGIAGTSKDYVEPTLVEGQSSIYSTVGYTQVCTSAAKSSKKGASQQEPLCSRSEDRCVEVREKSSGSLIRHCTVQADVQTDNFATGDEYDVAIGGISGGNYSCATTTQTYHAPGADTPKNDKGYMLVATEDKCAGTPKKEYRQYDTCVLSSLYVPGDDNQDPDEPTDTGKSGTRGTSTQNNGKDTYTCTRQDNQETYEVELYSTGAVLAGVSDKISGLQNQLSSKLDASNLSFEKNGNTLVLKSGDTTLNVSGLDNLKGDRGNDAANAFNYLGDVDTYDLLPTKFRPNTTEALQQGDGFLNNDDGRVYVWDGEKYPANGNGIPWKGEQGTQGPRGNDGSDACVQISTVYHPGCIAVNGVCPAGGDGDGKDGKGLGGSSSSCGTTDNPCTKAGYMTVTSAYTNSTSCPDPTSSQSYNQDDTCMLTGLNAGATESGDSDVYECVNQNTNATYYMARTGAGSVAHAILGMSINGKTLRQAVANATTQNDL